MARQLEEVAAVERGAEPAAEGRVRPEPDDPALRILRAIRKIVRGISSYSKRLAAETGLTVPQAVCLQALAQGAEDGLSVTELAGRVSLSPGTASRVVERLVRAGLVERRRRQRDRRLVAVSLTELGRERIAAMPPLFHERFLEGLHALSAEERAAVQDALDRVVALLHVEGVDASPILATELDLGEG
jgi:DNA-binding MarR family transcriptional regulator